MADDYEGEISDLKQEVERLKEVERDYDELKEKVEELTGSCHTDEQLRELQNSHEDMDRVRSAMYEHLDEDDADLEHLIDEIIPKWKKTVQMLNDTSDLVVGIHTENEKHMEWVGGLKNTERRIRSKMSEHLGTEDLEFLIEKVIPTWKGQQPPAEPQEPPAEPQSSQQSDDSVPGFGVMGTNSDCEDHLGFFDTEAAAGACFEDAVNGGDYNHVIIYFGERVINPHTVRVIREWQV
eukprot:SAG22_NODE_485_length_9905_cov_35.562003_5_plen_237_part_00